MEPKELLDFLHISEKLKCNTRHSYTSNWRHESVAEHSWRLALMALLMKDQIPGVDMDKVLRMCLIHDLGEAITGDIPSFEKTDANERTEAKAIDGLVASLPQPLSGELAALFAEMEARETPEARVFRPWTGWRRCSSTTRPRWKPGSPWSMSSTAPTARRTPPPIPS